MKKRLAFDLSALKLPFNQILRIAASVALLFLAFPPADWWLLSWIALIPFFSVLDEKKPRKAFVIGYHTGILFFTFTLYWFIHVTLLGAILLVAYMALYFAVFGLVYCRWKERPRLERLILLPSVWIALELVRAHLFTGFGWVSLGYSQYKNLWISQIADVTGVYGVSFLIVMVNVFLKDLWEKYKDKGLTWKTVLADGGKWVIGLLVLSLLYGLYQWPRPVSKPRSALRVGIVQANIPQVIKWARPAWPSIMEKHLSISRELLAEKPDMIIWPETAFPGFLWQDPTRFETLKQFAAESKTPLLLGLITNEAEVYYNSAVLLSAQGESAGRYDKLHLVPFGEYIPFRGQFPFLTDIIPIGDFTPGKEYTVFSLGPEEQFKGRPHRFSVLICFEDGVPAIARRFVREGAQFLINITNDAWFMDTQAPFLHLQASVFRAIENRRPVIRSANTGVSCIINSRGDIHSFVQQGMKKTFVAGYAAGHIWPDTRETFYTKFGDFFTYLCFGCILWGIITKRK